MSMEKTILEKKFHSIITSYLRLIAGNVWGNT